jgi:hypothetical protein
MRNILKVLIPLILMVTSGAARANPGTHFYMVMFAAESQPNLARTAHTFATFVREDNGVLTQELTVSWLPQMGYFGPNNSMPPLATVPGRNYTLDQTIALSTGRRTSFWGPYEITPQLYARAQQRVAFLNSGATSYKMTGVVFQHLRDNALRNMPGGAINCIMAVSDIGGYLDTGTNWGIAASSQVLGFFAPQGILDDIRFSAFGRADIAQKMNLMQRIGR